MAEQIAVLDGRGRIVETNAAWRQFALDNGAVPGTTGVGANYVAICEFADEPEADAVAAGLRAMIKDPTTQFSLEYPCHAPDEERWFRVKATPFEEDGAPRVVVQHTLITAQRQAQDKASLRSRLLDEAPAAVIATDGTYRITEWNAGALQLYGWTRDEVLGKNVRRLLVPEAGNAPCDAALLSLARGDDWTGDMTLQRRDGSTFTAHVRDTIVLAEDGTVSGYVGVTIDVTERRRAEQNHKSAQQYLEAVTSHMGQGLITVDPVGELVYMNAAAERMLGWRLEDIVGEPLQPILNGSHPIGSPSGSENTPMLRSQRDGEILHVDEASFIRHDGSLLPVEYTVAPFETSAGVSGSVIVFGDIIRRKAEHERLAQEMESLKWVTRIHDALAQDGFRLYAQPIFDLVTGDVVQHELLIRMLDTDGAVIPPGAFLPAAERHGAIRQIDEWVIRQAAQLIAEGHPMEINLSAESIIDPDMADYVREALAAVNADPRNLVLELTETAILRDPDAGRLFLERVTALGCKVALDDFGTGYGGFTYLKNLPVDYLKIDVDFVRDLPHNTMSQQVVQAVVQLATGIGKKTVAEGVEDDETRELLQTYGVDYAQGYGLGRPIPISDSSHLNMRPHA